MQRKQHHRNELGLRSRARTARLMGHPTIITLPGKARPRMLVRGAAQPPEVDEIALLLYPTKESRRNYGGSTGKLIHL